MLSSMYLQTSVQKPVGVAVVNEGKKNYTLCKEPDSQKISYADNMWVPGTVWKRHSHCLEAIISCKCLKLSS